MIFVLWMLSFKPDFSPSSFTLIKRLFSSYSLSTIRVLPSAYQVVAVFPDNLDSSLLFIQAGISHDVLCWKLKWGRWQYIAFIYPFPNLESLCCSMSSSKCWVLTWTQVFQEAGKVVLYSHIFLKFPQFVVIHTAKTFSIVNEAGIDDFLEFPCFFYDSTNVGNLISGSSAFLKPTCTYTFGIYQLSCCWSLSWRILSITLLACEMSTIVW